MRRKDAAWASSTTFPFLLIGRLLLSKVALLLELHRQQVEIEELRGQLVFTHPGDERKGAPGEQAQSLRALQDGAERYRALFEHPTLLTVVLQAVRTEGGDIADWIYADANRNALRVLRKTREALLGKRMSEVLPDRAERLIPVCAQVLTTQEPVHYESHFDSQDFLTCLFPAGPHSIVSTGIDVTARNRAELEVKRLLDALRAEKEWLFAVLNSINEEVYFTDPQGRYTYANPAALREFGHASLAGVPVETVVSDLIVLRADGTPRASGRSATFASSVGRDHQKRGAGRSYSPHGRVSSSRCQFRTCAQRRGPHHRRCFGGAGRDRNETG